MKRRGSPFGKDRVRVDKGKPKFGLRDRDDVLTKPHLGNSFGKNRARVGDGKPDIKLRNRDDVRPEPRRGNPFGKDRVRVDKGKPKLGLRNRDDVRPEQPTNAPQAVKATQDASALSKRPDEPRSGALSTGPTTGEIRRVLIDDVQVPDGRPPIHQQKVEEIIESLRLVGQKRPILVRARDNLLELVEGGHVLAAAKGRGREYIDALVIEGTDAQVEFRRLVENLRRPDLKVLDHDEEVVKLLKSMGLAVSGSGQHGQIAEAARALVVIGGSEEARRKMVQRATLIDGISPEGKKAARQAGLDDNQSALLTVAREKTPEAQVAKVRERVERKAAQLIKRQKRAAPEDRDPDERHTPLGESPTPSEPAQDPASSEAPSKSSADLDSAPKVADGPGEVGAFSEKEVPPKSPGEPATGETSTGDGDPFPNLPAELDRRLAPLVTAEEQANYAAFLTIWREASPALRHLIRRHASAS
jgi:ParB-like chromosome segregation protein Spo0J